MDAIVAVYADWGIGANGTQPVTVPADRKHFAELTGGAAIIVGRKTLADFPGGSPLKGRRNIVLTRQDIEIESASVVHTVEQALEAAEKLAEDEKLFVVGGNCVYSAFMPHVDRVFVTKIDICPHSDVFFENLDASPDWCCVDPGEQLEHEGIKYRFCTYERLFNDD